MTLFVDAPQNLEIQCACRKYNELSWTAISCEKRAYALCSDVKSDANPFMLWRIMNRPKKTMRSITRLEVC